MGLFVSVTAADSSRYWFNVNLTFQEYDAQCASGITENRRKIDNAMDLIKVNWKNDRITRDYVAENYDMLQSPENMSSVRLCEAITYCKTVQNPYTEVLIEKAGFSAQRQNVKDLRTLGQLLDKAAKSLGIILG